MAVVERWLSWKGGCCREVAVVERWPLWRGGCRGKVAVVERWLSWKGGCCGGNNRMCVFVDNLSL